MPNVVTGVVTGRVQGVGYRYFAREQASPLGLTGWVRNLPDGSVEFYAEGPEAALEEFLRRLRKGPTSGHVDGLRLDWLDSPVMFPRFEIRG
jgi:acylphosphatase